MQSAADVKYPDSFPRFLDDFTAMTLELKTFCRLVMLRKDYSRVCDDAGVKEPMALPVE